MNGEKTIRVLWMIFFYLNTYITYIFGQFSKSDESDTLKACEPLSYMVVHSLAGHRLRRKKNTVPVTLVGSAAFQTAVDPHHPAQRRSFWLPHANPPVRKVSSSSATTNVCCFSAANLWELSANRHLPLCVKGAKNRADGGSALIKLQTVSSRGKKTHRTHCRCKVWGHWLAVSIVTQHVLITVNLECAVIIMSAQKSIKMCWTSTATF